ncbi:MAG: hypothetical protein KF713_00160 [Turneriella sp.]|nr:hypothetical protein [Turneriella sp.]
MRFAQPWCRCLSFLHGAILISFSSLGVNCFQKPPQITYLSPVDRIQEGFLDPVTYQIVSYGRALDFSKPLDPKTTFLPNSISELFDHEAFADFNKQRELLLQQRKPVSGFPLGEILAAEANQLNPQEINLALIDEKIRAPMEIKKVLFDNACMNARILGLYRWLISDAMQMKLLHGATLPREGLQLTTLDARYFPPRAYYVAESADIAKNLDAAMEKKKFRYEIVQEVFSRPEVFECKIVIQVHKRNLQLNMPFLAPL